MSDDMTTERIIEALRAAILRRRSLPPGSARHWRATCDVRLLQDRLVPTARAPIEELPGERPEGSDGVLRDPPG